MNDYIQYDIKGGDDILMAFLSHLPFDTFEEREGSLTAYMPVSDYSETVENDVKNILKERGFLYQIEVIPGINWNSEWEKNFPPVEVENFVRIRAAFHDEVTGFDHEITISPKMAFGTGHHNTTYLMIKKMRDLDFAGKRVLDYGCGTGILAIVAAKLGAKNIDAIDIEYPSYENTKENSALNQITNISVYHGDLQVLKDEKYDFVLANINRNVLLESAAILSDMLSKGDSLLISGLLLEDFEIITDTYKNKGFKTDLFEEKENWIVILFFKD